MMSRCMTKKSIGLRALGSWWLGVGMLTTIGLGWPSMTIAGNAPREKMDCRVYETKTTSFGIGLRFGAMLLPLLGPLSPSASVTPLVNFDRKTGVAWDKAVHGIIARYVELCSRYNAGLVNKQEYEVRMKEIEGLYKEAQGLEAKLYEATRSHAKQAAEELNQELGKKKAATAGTESEKATTASRELSESVEAFADRVDQLEPVGRSLEPSRSSSMPPDPMKPPATTGTVGVSPDRSPGQP